ncbi:gastric triacylglycerol lipase-like [Eublepharis macularius]|uniref:Lipase n=1 Tax=Eublepharis macularius TaxID=481883 RepID=A0AA97JHX9_EUBMA|nr:gastric triacylglycerol lipase-like [Eublepharis macularius]
MWLALVFMFLLYGSVSGLDGEIDPEVSMTVKEIINYWGYPFEEYEIVTDDGYILTIHRIPYGRVNRTSPNPSPVYLQHGVLVDSSTWVSNLPENSLGFMLADSGFDVWMGNSRGNFWSRKHVSLSVDDVKYWEFSYDHMAKYDLPASINFILQKTGQQKLHYVAHSQGTTIGFICFSTMPQWAEKIKVFSALAPVATVKHAKTPAARFAYVPELTVKLIFGKKEFLPTKNITDYLAAHVCNQDLGSKLCSNILFLLCGYNVNNLNMSRLDVYLSHVPSGTSVQNMIHWKQAVIYGKLQAYDYGQIGNLLHYNQIQPPEYNIANMNVPAAIWEGGNDWLSNPADNALLFPKIKRLILRKIIENWNHLDFLYGLDAPNQLYHDLLNVLKQNP